MSGLWNISQGYSSRDYNHIINAFSQDSEIKKNQNSAFHYTSFENCIKMLKAPDENDFYLELFASHFSYMNDTKEFLQGLHYIIQTLKAFPDFKNEEINNTIKSFKENFTENNGIPQYAIPPHYIISFNTECNNLAQWKYYGKNCGVSIEYDLNNCVFSNYTEKENYVEHDSYYVNYNKEAQKNEVEKILCKLVELDDDINEKNKKIHCKDILLKACAAASFMKDENYKDEKEIRLLFAPYYQDEGAATSDENRNILIKKVEYRPRGTEYIIPYLRIRLKAKNENKYPIKSLTVGPGQNQKLIYNSLIMFVQSNFQKSTSFNKLPDEGGCTCVEVNGIKIKRSLIPFRG